MTGEVWIYGHLCMCKRKTNRKQQNRSKAHTIVNYGTMTSNLQINRASNFGGWYFTIAWPTSVKRYILNAEKLNKFR